MHIFSFFINDDVNFIIDDISRANFNSYYYYTDLNTLINNVVDRCPISFYKKHGFYQRGGNIKANKNKKAINKQYKTKRQRQRTNKKNKSTRKRNTHN